MSAAGLRWIPDETPSVYSIPGVGELIKDAIDNALRQFIGRINLQTMVVSGCCKRSDMIS